MEGLTFNINAFVAPSNKAELLATLREARALMSQLSSQIDEENRQLEALSLVAA